MILLFILFQTIQGIGVVKSTERIANDKEKYNIVVYTKSDSMNTSLILYPNSYHVNDSLTYWLHNYKNIKP